MSDVMKAVNQPQVLLVEDNPGDVLLMRQAFSKSKMSCCLHVANDADTALAILRCQGKYSNSKKCDVVLLDLNLPGKNGYEVLREIKCDPKLKKTPVIVLSSSESKADIDRVYRLHANSYIVKPDSIEKYAQAVNCFEEFWLEIARLAS